MFAMPSNYLATLFGSSIDSDCFIRFTLASDSAVHSAAELLKAKKPAGFPRDQQPMGGTASSKRSRWDFDARATTQVVDDGNDDCAMQLGPDGLIYLSEAIPAHRVVLRSCSERFRAYMERWEPSSRPAARQVPDAEGPCEAPRASFPPANTTSAASGTSDNQLQINHGHSPQQAAAADDQPGQDVGSETPGQVGQGTFGGAQAGAAVSGEGMPTTPDAKGTSDTSTAADAGSRNPGAPHHTQPLPETPTKKKRGRSPQPVSACSGGPSEILIPLGSEAELPAARRALRFMYTGSVSSSLGFKDILQTRSMGEYLQIEGCAQACDAALHDKLRAECAKDSAVVLDAYACWRAFPEDCSGHFAAFLDRCQTLLVRHFSDALSILNSDPDRPGSLHHQFLRLPPPAIEALLASEDFGTDSESSVLLLLGMWLDANPLRPPDLRTRLCSLIRVMHLSPAYAACVLPQLDWFTATQAQCTALAALAACPTPGQRLWLLKSIHANGLVLQPPTAASPSCSYPRAVPAAATSGSMWASPIPRRYCPMPRGLASYTWQVRGEDVEAAARAAAAGGRNCCIATFRPVPDGVSYPAAEVQGEEAAGMARKGVMAHGLKWRIWINVQRDEVPQVVFRCRVPLAGKEKIPGVQDLGRWPVFLSLQRSEAAAREGSLVAVRLDLGDLAPLGGGIGVCVLSEQQVRDFRAALAADPEAAAREATYLEPLRQFRQPNGVVCGEFRFGPEQTQRQA